MLKRVCPGEQKTLGIDVSKWQGSFDFEVAKANKVEFAFIKATEGESWRDSMFPHYRDAAKKAGILTGAYHFFRPLANPKKQAEHFFKTVGPYQYQDLPMVLDLETTDNVPKSQILDLALQFLNHLELLSSRIPIVYTGPYYFDSIRYASMEKFFTRYPLWLAHYGTRCPLVPEPWTAWAFWQFTDHLPMPGRVGGLDGNYFNGTLDQLKTSFP